MQFIRMFLGNLKCYLDYLWYLIQAKCCVKLSCCMVYRVRPRKSLCIFTRDAVLEWRGVMIRINCWQTLESPGDGPQGTPVGITLLTEVGRTRPLVWIKRKKWVEHRPLSLCLLATEALKSATSRNHPSDFSALIDDHPPLPTPSPPPPWARKSPLL